MWRRIFVLGIALLVLSGCFREAADSQSKPTQREVNLNTVQQNYTQTPTQRPTIPTFTPAPTKPPVTDVVGGPPVEDNTQGEGEQPTEEGLPPTETPTRTPTPTATNVPPDIATVAAPNYGDAGISPTPSYTPTPSQAPNLPTPTDVEVLVDECVYVVQGGDTLFSLALDYGLTPEDFYPVNPELFANPNSLYIGQEIRIPDCDSDAEGDESATPTELEVTTEPEGVPTELPQPTLEGVQTYAVQQGDTLFSIGLNFGVTVEDIVAANEALTSASSIIYPGDVLIIPTPQP